MGKVARVGVPCPLRLAIDMGGTFADLIVEGSSSSLRAYKSPTTPDDPATGILDVLDLAAWDLGFELPGLLGAAEFLMHGTTRATNAIVTGRTARTAFLTTKGHPDILLFREGGERLDPYDYSAVYPDAYVAR